MPILESNSIVWSPHLLKDINLVEDVQRKFTKFLPGLFNLPYLQRLEIIGIDSLELRRIQADLVYLFKIIKGFVDVDPLDWVSFNLMNTRGHDLKINVQASRTNCRKFFFVNRTIPVWNHLPAFIVNCANVESFKRELQKFNLSSYCRGRAYTAT